MAALDRIQQTVTAPLRLVQGAVAPGATDQQALREALRPLERRIDGLEADLEQRLARAVKKANEPTSRKLAAIEAELAELRQRIEQVLEDVDHIRTEQAAERAAEGS